MEDSEDNQIGVHKGPSSSSVQENESPDPTALPDLHVSIATTVAEDAVSPPPQVEGGTSSLPNRRSGATLGGVYITATMPSPLGLNLTKIIHSCHHRFCTFWSFDFWKVHQHQIESDHYVQSTQNRRQRSMIVPTQFNNSSARYTTPMTSTSLQFGQSGIYGGRGCSRTGGFQRLNEFNEYRATEDGGDTRRRRLNTNLSLSITQTSEPERNHACIDLLSRVGTSNSLENQDHDGDQDQNNQEDDGTLDLLQKMERKPSK